MNKVFLTTTLLGMTILASGVAHAGETIYGGAGEDYLEGTVNAEEIYGYKDDDILRGNNGHDKLYGGGGKDWMYGGAGRDVLWGQGGADSIDSGEPQDDGHNERQNGGSGKDTCWNADFETGKITYTSCYHLEDGQIQP